MLLHNLQYILHGEVVSDWMIIIYSADIYVTEGYSFNFFFPETEHHHL